MCVCVCACVRVCVCACSQSSVCRPTPCLTGNIHCARATLVSNCHVRLRVECYFIGNPEYCMGENGKGEGKDWKGRERGSKGK